MRVGRRDLLSGALLLGAGGVVPACSSPAAPSRVYTPRPLTSQDDVALAFYSRGVVGSGEDAIRELSRSLDWSWLRKGDRVFVKVASNSAHPHPATTSPAAVRGLCRELFARGAGSVTVGDQAGVESVRLVKGDVRYASTRAVMKENGLLAAIEGAGAEPHFFDEQGFDTGYFEATLPFAGSRWTAKMMLPEIIRRTDHIVYLPRLASHVICGSSHGHKLAMGWLRDDSRYHVHHDAAYIYEKYVEINHAKEIKDRLRLTLTLAEELMLDFGPDTGTVVTAEPRILIASRSLAAHDAVAAGVLVHHDAVTERTSPLAYTASAADGFNAVFVDVVVKGRTGLPWGGGLPGYVPMVGHAFEKGIAEDRALRRAAELGGAAPGARVTILGEAIDPSLRASLERWGGGKIALG